MASKDVLMAGPLCLIENQPDGELVVQEEAAGLLAQIRQPVVVVAIVGLYRTGKSYLMNQLAGKKKGFWLGATVEGMTKGIWMWCLPHPQRADCTLVLLDTEGLGDVGKGDTQNDAWIFALSILLSSTLVYNSMGTIDQNTLEKLQYVTELTQKIRTKSSTKPLREEENASEFVRFFPAFIWAVRDFTLELEIDGRLVSDDEYLENALKLQKGDTEQIKKCNMPRLCIRQFFPSRKCFTFDRPASKKNLRRLEELEEDDLEEDFLKPMARFCQHIWKTSKPKTVPGGQAVTGSMLANLAKTYVGAINSGQVPCLENAVLALAEIENAAAMREALSRYEEQVGKRVKLPTGTMEELLEAHAECEREATGLFLARAFGVNIKEFQEALEEELKRRKEELCKRNEQVSFVRCSAVLLDLSQELEEGIRLGLFSVPGGYRQFLEKRREIEEKYRLVPGKGIQADKALEDFLKSKETVAKSILQTDKALSNKEKEVEAQRAQAEAAQMQQKLLEQDQARLRQMVEDQKRSHEEQLQRLGDKMEAEKRRMKEETDRMMQHKLEEQKKLLEEGFYQKAKEMEGEIHRLKEEKESNYSALWRGTIETVLPQLASLGSQFLQYRMLSKLTTSGNPRNASGAASAPEYPSNAKSTK